ncbi:50S ribosomal protein L24, partial [Bacillus subtilis]|nr:50S ribosomal protein L24 [Bacillus subtilis]
NVMPLDPITGEVTGVVYNVEDGKNVRVAKNSGPVID